MGSISSSVRSESIIRPPEQPLENEPGPEVVNIPSSFILSDAL